MLCINPEKRITVDDALKHPYLENIADEEDYDLQPPNNCDFEFEKQKDQTFEDLIKLILAEVEYYSNLNNEKSDKEWYLFYHTKNQ